MTSIDAPPQAYALVKHRKRICAWTSTSLRRVALVLAAHLLTSPLLAAQDCRFTAERTAETPVDGVVRLVVRAGAGSLDISGKTGTRTVRASGTACASSKALLERIQLRLERRGDELVLEALAGEASVSPRTWFRGSQRLDLSVTLPAGLAIDVEDDSGETQIANVGEARIVDGSGSLEIEHVRGALNVRDKSGSLTIRNVEGPVRVEDGSGELAIAAVAGDVIVANDGSGDIEIDDIKGNVTIGPDGSGDISITRVAGSVRIENDGAGAIVVRLVEHDVTIEEDSSGDIVVEDVRGNLTIRNAGSGSVQHRNIGGKVSL
ncbi:MAG: hypothetical protein C0P74_009835 [Gammaproteobacteria bacterium]